jgi:8-oxo-dGTP diphosphatase
VVVDVANVMGARADGWWRDRAGAAARLCREVMALAERSFPSYVLVLEGQARAAATRIGTEISETEMSNNVPPRVRVVSAAGSGDDTIVAVVAEIAEIAENLDGAAEGASCLVVTADRELRRRCEALGAATAGPGWLLGQL